MAHLSELNLRHLYSGKVRDLYEVDDKLMLMVASDRLSAYDVVMNEPIPDKGRVLTGLTDYWVNEFSDVPSALVSCDPRVIDQTVVGFYDRPELHGRTMLVRRAEMLNLECVVRGRLAGTHIVGRPDPRRIGRQHFVTDRESPIDETQLKLRIGEY